MSNVSLLNLKQTRKDVSKVEDPFDAPTYNIPEGPVTFTEGASYGVDILAGPGIAAAAGYAVFEELIFEPKEYGFRFQVDFSFSFFFSGFVFTQLR